MRLRSLALLTSLPIAAMQAQQPTSAPISDIQYTVTVDSQLGAARTIRVGMRFATTGTTPVLLSMPVWTPGAYEVSNFARYVSNFVAMADGRPLDWDKLDHDTWRVTGAQGRRVTVSFEVHADTLDNAMAWTRPDFAMFNGTTVFPYPEGRGFNFAATVRVEAPQGWIVATGMTPATPARTYTAPNYHDLVDMPFFVGRFDFDSTRIADTWVRLATYPAGSVSGPTRAMTWDWLRRMIPPQVAVFKEAPFRTYTVMQIADSSYGGASGLEHQNSHIDIVTPFAIGNPFLSSLYAHEVFHAWNVKRMRPSELWPYRYDDEAPTPLLWVSEGITDYYADLSLVRGGIIDSVGFFGVTAGKITEVEDARPVALEDASLSTWVHPVDGTGYIYYSKGSLAGLLLDIMIRDASDNRRSLDDVMAQVYAESFKRGRGFTSADWWRVVTQAAGGKSFTDFARRYIDGREPFPWATTLPLAGMRLVSDTVREPRLGIISVPGPEGGVMISSVDPTGAAAEAGLRAGDMLISVGNIAVEDQDFGQQFRQQFGGREGAPLEIKVRRGEQELTLNTRVRLVPRVELRIDADPGANAKAARIRSGILRGTTGGS
ncbi:MAG: PDZ domain-containing protein [Gemmatimonadota bacterium]|nr:PDZ domain-containing protein [Gemmatimonadota bacterium]